MAPRALSDVGAGFVPRRDPFGWMTLWEKARVRPNRGQTRPYQLPLERAGFVLEKQSLQ